VRPAPRDEHTRGHPAPRRRARARGAARRQRHGPGALVLAAGRRAGVPRMLSRLHADRMRGHTMLEALFGIALLALLAAVALPSLRAQVEKSRRADAMAALFQAQLAQERWRANQPAYGSLTQI